MSDHEIFIEGTELVRTDIEAILVGPDLRVIGYTGAARPLSVGCIERIDVVDPDWIGRLADCKIQVRAGNGVAHDVVVLRALQHEPSTNALVVKYTHIRRKHAIGSGAPDDGRGHSE